MLQPVEGPPTPAPLPPEPAPVAPPVAAAESADANHVWPPGEGPDEVSASSADLVIDDAAPEIVPDPPQVEPAAGQAVESASAEPVDAATDSAAAEPTPAPQAAAPPERAMPAGSSQSAQEVEAVEPESPPIEPEPIEPPAPEPSPEPSHERPAPLVTSPAPEPEPIDPPVSHAPAPSSPETLPSEPAAPAPERAKSPGEVLWRYPQILPGQGEQLMPLRNRVAYNSEGVLFAAVGENLVAVKCADEKHEVLWRHPLAKHAPGCVAWDEREQRVFVHSGDGQLHGLSSGGEALWAPVDVGEPLGWASPLVDRDGTIYISCYTGGICKVDFNGNLQRDYVRSRQKFDCTGFIDKGKLYVGGEDGFVYAIELSGRRGKNCWDHWEGQGKTEWFINSALAWSPLRRLIVAGRDEFLYSFHDTGALDWRLRIGGQMLGSPVIDGAGQVFVGVSIIQRGRADRGLLVAVCPKTEQVLWEYQTRGAVESTPVLGDDEMIYVGDNAGFVHAVDRSGRCQWTTDLGGPVRSAGAIVTAHLLVFGSDAGGLIGMRCSSESVEKSGWPQYSGC
ncbi:MAG: PQQ-binding-like beta-propeller repeat protein [Pirellulaceae bacterium]|nr:PQQ-binding-like beta-propeller repeat protein [Pirellulaceae bacterium]